MKIFRHHLNFFRILVALTYGLLSAVGVNVFLVHANSYSSGLTGAAQLVQGILDLTNIHLSLALLVALFNIPLFAFAWKVFGTRYIAFSGLAVFFNIIFLKLVPTVQLVPDPLTNTIVGAVLIGASVGFCFNNGFTTGGIDIVTTYLQKKFHQNVGSIANVVNGLILVITAIFFGPHRIVYSLIGMLITNYTVDHFFSHQRDVTVTIYTKHPEAIEAHLKDFAHGATLLHGTGVYTNEPTAVIQIVTPRGRFHQVRQMATEADPEAFIAISRTDVEVGNYRHFTF